MPKKIAIITGASTGFGKEFAIQYAKQNKCDEMWLIARRLHLLENTKQTIEQNLSALPKIKLFSFDISGKDGVCAFNKLLLEEKNKNDFEIVMLINNAGFGTYGSFIETEIERQLKMIDLNVYSLTGFCHAAIPFMKKGSCIINVASMAAFIPVGNFAVYAATKAFVLSFSITLRAEIKDLGINVTALCPGQSHTEFAQTAIQNKNAKMKSGKQPDKIVAHCLKCAEKHKKIAVYGLDWKISAFLTRFMSREFFAGFSFKKIKRIESTISP